MILRCLLAAAALAIAGCVPIQQSSTFSDDNPKTLQLRDYAYEPSIKSVMLYPETGDPQDNLKPAVTELGNWNLALHFDDLRPDHDSYTARIIHCNRDWTKSALQDLDFLPQFNGFPILQYDYSINTHLPYVHYWLTLPAVKLPGNYVVVVYRGDNKDDIILTRRFMVYTRKISFGREPNMVGAGSVADAYQQFNFTVNYTGLDVMNPLENIAVNIRQNQRWDNMRSRVPPSFVNESQRELQYRYFDKANMFRGGNEFRWFDIRSLNYPGRNIARVDKTVKPFEIFVNPDKSRDNLAYAQYTEMNGQYFVANLDYSDLSAANYAYVNFTLVSPQLDGKVFLIGAFNNWNTDEQNKLVYNADQGIYTARILLKQGIYDYQYEVISDRLPPDYIEGSHYQTGNEYEVFVYYRPFQPNADLLVGYLRFEENPR